MRHEHYHHGLSPFMIFAIGVLLFWMIGFKVFFFLPLFFLFGAFGMRRGCGMRYDDGHDWASEKPKRKRKNDDYYVIDDGDDVTYL